MSPSLRRVLPVLAPFVLGALAYFALGAGPHTEDPRAGAVDAWALPAETPRDFAAASQVWSKRSPWGVATAAGEAGADAGGGQPVGVIAVGDRLQALFAFPDGRVIRVGAMDALPDGGQVTQITSETVAWTDAAGRAQRRELLVDPALAGAAAEPAASAGRGSAADRIRSGQRPPRPAVRPSGQRPARPAVQPRDGSGRSSPPATRPNRSGDRPAGTRPAGPNRPASSRPASRD